ncbi:MAG: type II toxin-antitoxin system VapC family toxin [Chloroflexota bacterium]
MTAPIFLDANIFMYAAGKPHEYKQPCREILQAVEAKQLTAATNTEVLQEILYRYHHVQLPDKGIQLCRYILEYPLTILPVTPADITNALELLSQNQNSGLKPRDALHAATMQNNNVTQILSADKHFDRITGIQRLDPLTFDL